MWPRLCFWICVYVCVFARTHTHMHTHMALGLALYGSSHPGYSYCSLDLTWLFWHILGPRACVLSVGGLLCLAVLGPVPVYETSSSLGKIAKGSVNASESRGFSERCSFPLMTLKLFLHSGRLLLAKEFRLSTASLSQVWHTWETGQGSCIRVRDGDMDHTGGSKTKNTAEQGWGASIVTLHYC